MNKEEIINGICERIKAEHRKHETLEWERIAAYKIYSQFFENTLKNKCIEFADWIGLNEIILPITAGNVPLWIGTQGNIDVDSLTTDKLYHKFDNKGKSNFELIDQHKKDCSFYSFMGHMKKSSTTYDEIIERGNAIIPDILIYLRDEEHSGMSVMLLLWEITKYSPYTPESIGGMSAFNVSEAVQAWIQWGKNEKLI